MTLYVGECRRCGAQHMNFDVYGLSVAEQAQAYEYYNNRRYRRTIELACKCHECDRTTVYVLSADKSNAHELPKTAFEKNENPKTFGYAEVGAFPPKAGISTPADTPKNVANFFSQGATAFGRELFDATGAMFRKSLEAATRSDSLVELVPTGEREEFKKNG